MSVLAIVLLSVLGYVVLGIGTARTILTILTKRVTDSYDRRWSNDDIQLPTIFGGVLWPVSLVYLLLIRPLILVVGPGFARWFTAPARKAGLR